MYLRTFLMRHPRPTKIMVGTADGDREVAVAPDATWSHVAEAVEILSPTTIQCIGSKGEVLRAIRADELDIEEREAADAPSPYMARMAIGMPKDADSARLLMFAQLLSDAYRHTTDVAFARMVDLFTAVNKRHESTEKSLELMHKLLRKLTEEKVSSEPSSDDMLTEMLGAFLSSKSAAESAVKAPKPVNGTPNGKAHS